MIDESLLKQEERAVFSLRSLYSKYGYLPYKMGKFEEYDFYLRNKDFLISDRILSFTDTNGRLMALKPDVTLSIIKNAENAPGCKQKLCYNENVYRVDPRTQQYKEILQTGLECIGDIDEYDLFEVLLLAMESLRTISEDYILDLSHLGLLTAILDGITQSAQLRRQITRCIAEKNTHDLERILKEQGVETKKGEELCSLAGLYGPLDDVLTQMEFCCSSDTAKTAWNQLRLFDKLFQTLGCSERVFFDFSVVNDMNYYNGIVFKGFLNGIPEGILAGGQYDKLARRMGRSGGAVGFALYLDLLEELRREERDYDVDCLVLYDEKTAEKRLLETVQSLLDKESVSAQKAIPQALRYRRILDLRGGGAE